MRPTGYPDWAVSSTNVAEPSTAEKLLGWEESERPPSSYFNWMQGMYGRWIRHLDWSDAVSEDFSDVIEESGLGIAFHQGTTLAVLPNGWTGSSGVMLYAGGMSGSNVFSNQDPEAPMGVMSVRPVNVGVTQTSSGFSYKILASPGNRDWRMEIYGAAFSQSCASGSYMLIGATAFHFTATMPSGTWMFGFQPSGLGITSVNLGLHPNWYHGATNLRLSRFLVEREGATMIVKINTPTGASGAFAGPNIAMPGVPPERYNQRFGAFVNYCPTGANSTIRFDMDAISFKVRRNPT